MPRPTLAESQIHPAVLERVTGYHAAVVAERSEEHTLNSSHG